MGEKEGAEMGKDASPLVGFNEKVCVRATAMN